MGLDGRVAAVGTGAEVTMGPTIREMLPHYLPRNADQIRELSAGSVKRRMRPGDRRDDWASVRDTIWDQRIFGPERDWECACGRMKGELYTGSVCDICSVRVVTRRARRFRRGHINLPLFIPHPLLPEAQPLDVIPIVPTCHWETYYGRPLAKAYEDVLHGALAGLGLDAILSGYAAVMVLLDELYPQYSDHDPDQADRIAWGFALKRKEEEPLSVEDQEAGEGTADGIDWDHLELAPDED
jgi:hypothetical protein